MANSSKKADLLAPFLLLFATVLGFILSNSLFSGQYDSLLKTDFVFKLGDTKILHKSLLMIVNDGLMAIFFLYVGLELRRELLLGELSSLNQALLPLFSAVGGMIVPALIYFSFNFSGEKSNGWGVPMATDIAFALGILALLGSRVPSILKILLTAIAIVDDLGAILVIALFYTSEVDFVFLGGAASIFGICILANFFGIVRMGFYLFLGIPLWYFMLKSGVHATIAGVLIAFVIPLKVYKSENGKSVKVTKSNIELLPKTVAHKLEMSLHDWVSYLIIPLFAFFNSGISLNSLTMGSVSFGVILGLVLGKPIGIVGAAYLGHKLNFIQLPSQFKWRQFTGVGFIAGIGFTMSLFISSLAFTDTSIQNEAKFAILLASILAGLIGSLMFLKK